MHGPASSPDTDGFIARHGLWSDGVHPNAAPSGACDLTESGLDYGQKYRNLPYVGVIEDVTA